MSKKLVLLSLSIILSFVAINVEATRIYHKNITYASLPTQITPPGQAVFIYNPRILRWAAYNASGARLATGQANGGSSYCPDIERGCRTPSGVYHVISKGDASCKSRLYPIKRIHGQIVRGGAHMPYCMYFSEVGYAIHGYAYLANHNNSHGCIRVSKSAAQWLSTSFIHVGTKVIILPY